MDTLARLRGTALFSEMDDNELNQLAEIVTVRKVPSSGMLFFENDPATGFFILLSGQVRIFKSAPDGKEYTLHHIDPGQMFAEAAIFRGTTFPANCQALKESEVLHIPKVEFIQLLSAHPGIAIKMIGRLSAWLREFTLKLESLSLKEVPARLSAYILHHIEADADSFTIETSKSALASELGTISETLSRAFRKMSDSGVIAVQGNSIKILDRNRLEDIADGEKI
jgi:CRP/FNR family transcriptional regulator